MGSIPQIIVNSYRDTIGLFRRAGTLMLATLIILALGDIASYFGPRVISTTLGKTLVSTLAIVAALWFATPYLVRLLRMVLADRIDPAREAYDEPTTNMRFFAWSSVFAFAAAIPQWAFLQTPPITTPTIEDADVMALFYLTFALLIALWIFTARTVTILPAIALGRDIGLREAFAHTRGRFWFVVLAVFLPIVPLALFGRVFVAATDGVVYFVLSISLSVVTEILALAVSAHIYRWLMDNPK